VVSVLIHWRLKELHTGVGIDRRSVLRLISGAGLAALATTRSAKSFPLVQPNIIFIMLDDLGKEGVHCYGGAETITPNLDRIAASGMTFMHVYSMPLCVASRVTFITGQYPARHGWINDWNVPLLGVGHLDPHYYPSIARVLREAGYATAIAGKWHLNDFRDDPEILYDFGFDEYCVWTGVERDNVDISSNRYWSPYIHTEIGSRTYHGEFSEDIFTRFILRFLRERPQVPKFVYYPMCLPHFPPITVPNNPIAGANLQSMIHYADFKLGQILSALDGFGIRNETIVFWTSDNGSPQGTPSRLNRQMVRGGKGTLGESGINVPFIANCPGLIPGGVITGALIDFTDLLPTFADLAGATLPTDATLDGRSFAGHLLGLEADGPRRWIMAMGGERAVVSPLGRLVPVRPYAPRVVRDKRYKLLVAEDRTSSWLVDLALPLSERGNLLESTATTHQMARASLERADRTLPPRDAAPRYDPLQPRLAFSLPSSGEGSGGA
jgi:arylsulfatase A-like enzyme